LKTGFKQFDESKVVLADKDCILEGLSIMYEYIEELTRIKESNRGMHRDTIKSLDNQISIIEAAAECVERGLSVVLVEYIDKSRKKKKATS
jgi:hypothetical protein